MELFFSTANYLWVRLTRQPDSGDPIRHSSSPAGALQATWVPTPPQTDAPTQSISSAREEAAGSVSGHPTVNFHLCLWWGNWEVWGTFVLISPAVTRGIHQRWPLQSKGISDVPSKAVLGVLSTLLLQIQGEHSQLLPCATSEGVYLHEPSSPVLISTFAFWYHLQPRLQILFLCSLNCVPLKWGPSRGQANRQTGSCSGPGSRQ